MSSNSTLERFQNLLLPVFQYYNDQKLPTDEKFKYSQKVVSHKDLLNHIENGTSDSFRIAMRQHLEPHFDRVLKWVKS